MPVIHWRSIFQAFVVTAMCEQLTTFNCYMAKLMELHLNGWPGQWNSIAMALNGWPGRWNSINLADQVGGIPSPWSMKIQSTPTPLPFDYDLSWNAFMSSRTYKELILQKKNWKTNFPKGQHWLIEIWHFSKNHPYNDRNDLDFEWWDTFEALESDVH